MLDQERPNWTDKTMSNEDKTYFIFLLIATKMQLSD